MHLKTIVNGRFTIFVLEKRKAQLRAIKVAKARSGLVYSPIFRCKKLSVFCSTGIEYYYELNNKQLLKDNFHLWKNFKNLFKTLKKL